MDHCLFKLVLVGASSSGKTSLISRIVDDTFSESTTNIDFVTKTFSTESQVITFQFWDSDDLTSSDSTPIKNAFYRNADGVLLLCDLSDNNSIPSCTSLFNDVRHYCPSVPIFFVPSKLDLSTENTLNNATFFAKQHDLTSASVSSLTGEGVSDLIDVLLTRFTLTSEESLSSFLHDLSSTQSQNVPSHVLPSTVSLHLGPLCTALSALNLEISLWDPFLFFNSVKDSVISCLNSNNTVLNNLFENLKIFINYCLELKYYQCLASVILSSVLKLLKILVLNFEISPSICNSEAFSTHIPKFGSLISQIQSEFQDYVAKINPQLFNRNDANDLLNFCVNILQDFCVNLSSTSTFIHLISHSLINFSQSKVVTILDSERDFFSSQIALFYQNELDVINSSFTDLQQQLKNATSSHVRAQLLDQLNEENERKRVIQSNLSKITTVVDSLPESIDWKELIFDWESVSSSGQSEVVHATFRLADVVVKLYHGSSLGVPPNLAREFSILNSLPNVPSLPRIYGLTSTVRRGVKRYGLVMERLSTDTLKDRLSSLTMDQRFSVLISIGSALAICHDNFFLHRDLKPENCLFRGLSCPVLIDWGSAKNVGNQALSMSFANQRVLTPLFATPELVADTPIYSFAIDVFSFGLLIIYVLTGTTIWEDFCHFPDRDQRIINSLVNKIIPPIPHTIPFELFPLLSACLDTDLSKRPPMNEVVSVLAAYSSRKSLSSCILLDNYSLCDYALSCLHENSVKILGKEEKIELFYSCLKILELSYHPVLVSKAENLVKNLIDSVDLSTEEISRTYSLISQSNRRFLIEPVLFEIPDALNLESLPPILDNNDKFSPPNFTNSEELNPSVSLRQHLLESLSPNFNSKFSKITDLLDLEDSTNTNSPLFSLLNEASSGSVKAISSLARTFYYGLSDQSIDFNQSFFWANKGFELNDGYSTFILAIQTLCGLGTESNLPKGFKLMKKAAKLNCLPAITDLGFLYSTGIGTPSNFIKSAEYYKQASELGHFEAMFKYSAVLQAGRGCEQDLRKSKELLIRARVEAPFQCIFIRDCYRSALGGNGNPWELLRIASFLTLGAGFVKDLNRAFKLTEHAASFHLPFAQLRLSFLLKEGNGIYKDLNKAYYYANSAFEQGFASAAPLLADLLQTQRELNLPKIKEILIKGADGGDVYCMTRLGLSLLSSNPPQYLKAVDYFTCAAELGDPKAMYELAMIYQYGRGVARDLKLAKHWSSKAEISGYFVTKPSISTPNIGMGECMSGIQ
ncbi:hypothetical protein RCL1_007222 [Eukaryota sp. TZLM3-RCL]